ncbi:ribulose-phosphate 3-epimerase [Mycoplasmopsis lipofaciens]|uniref:ribulose-phosphate 3-epimerase n=1 Tax=Mycoplasmopsis lipofaciens TaxID=114884 RepID=UPI0004835DB5|nr:ribulose-phosphate 3-epimerase [Mycoplasmopsis lipofaciens]
MNINQLEIKVVAPSLLNVEENERVKMVNTLCNAGIQYFHYDVMDGEFVPNIAISVEQIKELVQSRKQYCDVHLMVNNPLPYIEELKDFVPFFTIHYESMEHKKLFNILRDVYVKNQSTNLGIAIKPNTKVEDVEDLLPYISLITVMSVEPGKGGQKFMPNALNKIKELKAIKEEKGYLYSIEVDGGINDITGPQCFEAGADICVAGTFLITEPTSKRIQSIMGIK